MTKVQEVLIKNYSILLRGKRIKEEDIPYDSVTLIIDGSETISTIRQEAIYMAASDTIKILNK